MPPGRHCTPSFLLSTFPYQLFCLQGGTSPRPVCWLPWFLFPQEEKLTLVSMCGREGSPGRRQILVASMASPHVAYFKPHCRRRTWPHCLCALLATGRSWLQWLFLPWSILNCTAGAEADPMICERFFCSVSGLQGAHYTTTQTS